MKISKRVKLVLILILVMRINWAYSQQESQYTQYMYNTMALNPAYTGTNDMLNISGLYRKQWIGLDGAPQTNTFSIDSPISDKNVSLGLLLVDDMIGPTSKLTATINAAYKFNITRDIKLSFGMNMGVENYRVDYTLLDIYDPNDIAYQENVQALNAVVGAGMYLFSDNWYVGLSAPNIYSDYYVDKYIQKGRKVSHYYLMGGYVYQLNRDIKLKPSLLLKLSEDGYTIDPELSKGVIQSVDLSMNALFYNRFSMGVAYRSNSSASALLSYYLNRKMIIGYAYDYTVNDIAFFANSSHEVFLKYSIDVNNIYRVNRKFNPRFF